MRKFLWLFFVAVMVANIGMMSYLLWDMYHAPIGGVGPLTHANGDAKWVAYSIIGAAAYGLFVLIAFANPFRKN